MSAIYDNWERLVEIVLRREQFRQLCRADSLSSSFQSTSSSNSHLGNEFEEHGEPIYKVVLTVDVQSDKQKPKAMEKLDDIINRLLELKGRPGKQVQLSEAEIKHLCLQSKEIFLKQPNLLDLEAPIKICGKSIITMIAICGRTNGIYSKILLHSLACKAYFKIPESITPALSFTLLVGCMEAIVQPRVKMLECDGWQCSDI